MPEEIEAHVASTFSPLFVGVRSATKYAWLKNFHKHQTFSPLFVGVRSATNIEDDPYYLTVNFQSPFRRG